MGKSVGLSFRDFRVLISILAEESAVLKQRSPILLKILNKLEAVLVLFIKEKNRSFKINFFMLASFFYYIC